ncbi:MAG: 3-oxoacyl-[acyl-carrier-protein] synthase 3 [Planctomycetota bacterium]|nr:MAG: 3-oxoacyl-[acyl-carrier-protein] synthase 3 [Planctomycetota bacterium]
MTRVPFGIRGTGSSVPEKILSNDDLSQLVETSDEWITQRTGIKERRILEEGRTTSDLCIDAARKALDAAQMNASELDLIILGTVTPDRHVSATACKIQKELGCGTIPAFDMAAGCTGFIYASSVASQFLGNGTYKNVLVIGAEALSRITNYRDRTSCILFGDGAGAVIYSTEFEHGEMLGSEIFGDGNGYDVMYQLAGASEMAITPEVLDANDHKLVIRGREVYKFAVGRMVELIRGQRDAHPELELGAVVPHQVNMRIIESACQKLDLPIDRLFLNIEKYGNTSAGSVPIALDEAIRSGFLDDKSGKLLVMCAFGAGLTWGSLGIRW